MPRLLKDLVIDDVSSVDRGAGVGVKVMLMKSANTREAPVQTVTVGIDAVRKSYLAGEMSAADVNELLNAAVRKLQAPGETEAQTLARSVNSRDTARYNKKLCELFSFAVEIGKVASKPKVHSDGGGVPPDLGDAGADAASLEELVADHMKANPSVTSKTRAYQQVMATDAGKKIMQRDRQRAGLA